MSNEKTTENFKKALQNPVDRILIRRFGIKLDSDVVSITTDGASNMILMGKLSGLPHIICMAHTVHLAVTAAITPKKNHVPVVDVEGLLMQL